MLIHSTPYRRPLTNIEKIVEEKRPDLEYDKFSWVKYSRVDSPEIVTEGLMVPIFQRPHESVTLTNYYDKFVFACGGILAEKEPIVPLR